jgi:hypothetical protein
MVGAPVVLHARPARRQPLHSRSAPVASEAGSAARGTPEGSRAEWAVWWEALPVRNRDAIRVARVSSGVAWILRGVARVLRSVPCNLRGVALL